MSQPKPKHLRAEYGRQFSDTLVVDAYRFRPAYPDEVFDVLRDLAAVPQPCVLDLGCGPGEIGRGLASGGAVVDAVDPSQAMVDLAQTLAHHDDVRWFVRSAEAFDYPRQYDLVVAAESLHWMEWDAVLPAVGRSLSPTGRLAIVGRRLNDVPWWPEIVALVRQYSTNRDYAPYDLVDELEQRALFTVEGRHKTAAVARAQPVEAYVEFWHSRNGLSRERMGRDAASRFDAGVREAVAPHIADGQVRFPLRADIVWGRPT